MFVQFEKLKFANILSYGAKITEINFKSGLHLISGKNGDGKSSIIDALSFCLYGVPYRNIKINELINRKNKKKLYTELDFKIDNNHYNIVRKLAPSKIIIHKNGDLLENLSSKRLTQEEINKILGIDYNLFKQIISLSITYNKPFLSLRTSEKRDIIESIFNIKVFGEMLKVLKKNNSGLKTQSEIHGQSISLLENTLRTYKKQLKDMKVAIRDFERNKNGDLKRENSKLKSLIKEKDRFEKNIERKTNMVGKLKTADKLQELIDSRKDKERKRAHEEVAIKNVTKSMSIIDGNDMCPTCNQELTKEHKEKEVANFKSQLEIAEKLKEKYDKEIKTLIGKIERINNDVKKRNELTNEISAEKSKLKFYNDQITDSKNIIKEIDRRTLNFDLESFNKTFNEKKEEYKEVYKENKSVQKTIKNNDIVSNILSENGIKAYFFQKLIPVLNTKINEYLNKFDLPIQLVFNELMEENITSIAGTGKNLNYYSFSEGEKKRIDMSIMLSFISITKMICNWNCNLIIMDEILDTSIDEEGLYKLIGNIKNMIFGSKDSLCIYIISHRVIESGAFYSICEAKFQNGFSKLISVTDKVDAEEKIEEMS